MSFHKTPPMTIRNLRPGSESDLFKAARSSEIFDSHRSKSEESYASCSSVATVTLSDLTAESSAPKPTLKSINVISKMALYISGARYSVVSSPEYDRFYGDVKLRDRETCQIELTPTNRIETSYSAVVKVDDQTYRFDLMIATL